MNTPRLSVLARVLGGRRSVGAAVPSRRRQSAALPVGLAVLSLAFAAGCAHRAPRVTTLQTQPVPPDATAPALDPALLNPTAHEYTLGPGDRLDIELLDDPASRVTTTVGPDGKIYFYLLPGLDVWGMTLPQVRERLEGGMQEYFREKRPITVSLRSSESQRVWLLGRVNKPGVYPLGGNTTLLEALAAADGPASATPGAAVGAALGLGNVGQVMDDSSDLRRAFVLRNGQRLPVDLDRLLNRGDLSQNIRLQGGDFIYLPASGGGDVSILGAVGAARTVPYERDMTLVQAVAGAGGTIQDAFVRQVAIVRGSLTEPQIAVVDYEAIVLGRAPDVRLEPQDIVYVPYTPYRTLKRYVNMILDTFVRATGVNEGARAIDPSIPPPGVTVPVTITQ